MDVNNVFRIFPNQISSLIDKNKVNELQEIRIRTNRKTILKYNEELILEYIPDEREILNILQMLCENSVYSYQSHTIWGTQSRNNW